jgi:hypothetical protein
LDVDAPLEKRGEVVLRERWLARVMVCFYIGLLFVIAVWGFYILFYLFFLLSWVVLVFVIRRLRSFDFADSLDLWMKLLVVTIVALAVRFLLLIQDQIITYDIISYVNRGDMMLGGLIPYADFYGGSKPPLYNLTIYVMSHLFGAGEVQFRAVFSVIDALIAAVILFLGTRQGGRIALSASLLYALSPINVIAIGLSGHFDPVPTLAVVISAVLIIANRHRLASLFLGLGFALKLFAAALLPYYLIKARTIPKSALTVVLFLLPMALSLLGVYLISEETMFNYLDETSGWGGVWSFNHVLTVALGSDVLGPLKVSWMMMAIFVGLILLMNLTLWRGKNEDATILFWFKVVVLVSLVYWGLMILESRTLLPTPPDILPFIIALAIYSAVVVFALMRYWRAIFPRSILERRGERTLIVMTLAIMLFCFGLPNYTPWYVIWFLPFLLCIRTEKIRLTLLLLSVWRIMGVGISLLPGFPPIN